MAEDKIDLKHIRVDANEISSVVRELSVEIDTEQVDIAYAKVVKQLRKTARVKGFRPGKAPLKVIRQIYGAALDEEIERSIVGSSLASAIEMAELQPVVEPQIEAEPPVEGKAFRYKARIEVKPEIELPDLEALSGSRPAVEVGEDAVLTEMENLRERQVHWVEEAEDVVAEDGHQLTIDFVGSIDGVAFEGGSAEGVDLELGSGRMIPGFEEQLVGAKSGEERDLEVDFPAEYGNDELAGRAAVFAAKVTAIKRRELPELDDDFAKDLGEFETIDEVRDKIRENLREQLQRSSDEKLHRSLLDDLITRTSFEVPPTMVERQLESQIKQFEQQLEGRVPEPDLRARAAQMREEGWDEARRRVQEALLLENVAQQAELEASKEEIDARLDELAAGQGVDVKRMHDMAEAQGWREAIGSEVVDRKALAHLVEHAQIAEVEASEDA
jgi:trigger factor